MNKFTIILPSRGLDGKYLKLVLKSYEKYLNYNDVYEIIIITPDTRVQEYVKNYKNKYRIIHDDVFNIVGVHNWYKQQFIKLLVSQYVETDLYMIFDDDLFLVKPLSYNDIFIDNKIRYNKESFETLSTPNYSSKDWWIGSCKLLNLNQIVIENDNLMNVTPQIFITVEVLNLLNDLYEDFNWMDKFIEYKASEYSLYWLYLHSVNKQHLYNNESINWWYTDETTNILNTPKNLDDFKNIIIKGFTNNPGYFMVIQSYLNIPEKLVEQVINFLY